MKLNGKTGAVFMKTTTTINIFPDAQRTSLSVGNCDTPFTTCACNLGFKISGRGVWVAGYEPYSFHFLSF